MAVRTEVLFVGKKTPNGTGDGEWIVPEGKTWLVKYMTITNPEGSARSHEVRWTSPAYSGSVVIAWKGSVPANGTVVISDVLIVAAGDDSLQLHRVGATTSDPSVIYATGSELDGVTNGPNVTL